MCWYQAAEIANRVIKIKKFVNLHTPVHSSNEEHNAKDKPIAGLEHRNTTYCLESHLFLYYAGRGSLTFFHLYGIELQGLNMSLFW